MHEIRTQLFRGTLPWIGRRPKRRSAGHHKNLTKTGNRAWKVSGTQDNSNGGQLILYTGWVLGKPSKRVSLVSNRCVSQALNDTLQTTNWKAFRQSALIFFKFVHLLHFPQFGGRSHLSNFYKFCDTASWSGITKVEKDLYIGTYIFHMKHFGLFS